MSTQAKLVTTYFIRNENGEETKVSRSEYIRQALRATGDPKAVFSPSGQLQLVYFHADGVTGRYESRRLVDKGKQDPVV